MVDRFMAILHEYFIFLHLMILKNNTPDSTKALGTVREFRCNMCGNVFHVFEGTGSLGSNYYCSLCGKNYFKRHTDPKKSGYYLCECGGTLHNYLTFAVCPKCGSQDVIATGIEGTWE